MGIIAENVVGNQILNDDTVENPRWVDGFGENLIKYQSKAGNPCDDTTGDPTEYVMTPVEAGTGDSTMVNSVAAGEAFLLTTAANEYDGINAQVKGEAFKLSSGNPLYFGAKLKVSDATQSDLLIGLCETKTDLLKTGTAHGVNTSVEGVFFFKLDGVTTINAKAYLDGAETATANYGTALDTSYHIFEIYWSGSALSFYVDGVLVQKIYSGLPDGDLTPSINFRAGMAAAKTCNVAWIRCIQANA